MVMARIKVPDRMQTVNIRMSIDNLRVVASLDYNYSPTGITPMAIWVKIKPNESTLDRELRSSGKLASLLMQYGCPMKEIADTLTKDSIIGQVVNYITKNLEDILAGNQPDKIPNFSTDIYKIK
jgi:hypothetical protein